MHCIRSFMGYIDDYLLLLFKISIPRCCWGIDTSLNQTIHTYFHAFRIVFRRIDLYLFIHMCLSTTKNIP